MTHIMHPTFELARSPLFQVRSETLTWSERVQLSYDRAREVVKIYSAYTAASTSSIPYSCLTMDLTMNDILHLSEKYWQFHTDPILMMDGSVATLLTIHYNLCVGTLAMFSRGRPEIANIIDKLLRFDLRSVPCFDHLSYVNKPLMSGMILV